MAGSMLGEGRGSVRKGSVRKESDVSVMVMKLAEGVSEIPVGPEEVVLGKGKPFPLGEREVTVAPAAGGKRREAVARPEPEAVGWSGSVLLGKGNSLLPENDAAVAAADGSVAAPDPDTGPVTKEGMVLLGKGGETLMPGSEGMTMPVPEAEGAAVPRVPVPKKV